MKRSNDHLRLIESPRPAGAYWLGEVHFGLGIHLNKKPRWFHRLMMRWAFGFTWADE